MICRISPNWNTKCLTNSANLIFFFQFSSRTTSTVHFIWQAPIVRLWAVILLLIIATPGRQYSIMLKLIHYMYRYAVPTKHKKQSNQLSLTEYHYCLCCKAWGFGQALPMFMSSTVVLNLFQPSLAHPVIFSSIRSASVYSILASCSLTLQAVDGVEGGSVNSGELTALGPAMVGGTKVKKAHSVVFPCSDKVWISR